MDKEQEQKKFRISVGLIFNIAIFVLTIFLIMYFVFSEDGLIDLINSGLEVSLWWILAAVILHLLNITIDASIIYLFVRENTPDLKVRTALKASMVGQFYCAITPSATGGQPMQILTMSRSGVKGSVATSALIQKFLVWQFTLAAYCIVAVVARFSFFRGNLDMHMWILSAIGFVVQLLMLGALLLASFASFSCWGHCCLPPLQKTLPKKWRADFSNSSPNSIYSKTLMKNYQNSKKLLNLSMKATRLCKKTSLYS